MLFGVLLITGTTIREVPGTLAAMFGTRGRYADGYDDEVRRRLWLRRGLRRRSRRLPAAGASPWSAGPGRLRASSAAYSDEIPSAAADLAALANASGPIGTPYDNYPLDEDAPAANLTQPIKPRRRSRRSLRPWSGDAAALDRVVEGSYTLPSLELLTRRSAEAAQHLNDQMVEAISSVLDQFRSTPPSPAAPAARPSPVTRWNSDPASRSRKSPRCNAISPTRWPLSDAAAGSHPG